MTEPSSQERTPPRQEDVVPNAIGDDRERVTAVAQDMLAQYAALFERLQDS